MKKKSGRNITLRQKLEYRFDAIMAKGTISLVGILFAITLFVVVVSGVLVVLFDGKRGSSLGESLWVSLMHAVDAGTLAGDSGSFLFMLLMTLVTVCGLFITSVLIGIINTGMEAKMASLRKGKSCVLEEGHTIILGFERNIYVILQELIEANATHEERAVVVMDDRLEKEEMEEAIRQRIPDTKTTKIICRSGCISDLSDLHICSPEYARSIIINSDDDCLTIKAILATTALLKQSKNKDAYIAAVIHDPGNCEAARIAGENRAEVLFFEDTIARIVAHTSRQIGFASIYMELFSFGGDEIYIEEIPRMHGVPMGEINRYFPHSTVIGMEKRGKVMINPPTDTVTKAGDKLILIAENDCASKPDLRPAEVDEERLQPAVLCSPCRRQKMLILGYSPRLGKVLAEEDLYMAPGSEILLAVQEEFLSETQSEVRPEYENISVILQSGDIYHREKISELLAWKPDSILVCSSMQVDAQQDDNRTLLLLLQLRAISHNQYHYSITSEMRDVENQELAQVTEVRDFVISSKITSLMTCQISQSRELNCIFSELLSREGSEIYMRPARDYVKLGSPVSMYTAGAAAVRKNQVFIGYRRIDPKTGRFEMYTNPDKNKTVVFTENDCFAVLASD